MRCRSVQAYYFRRFFLGVIILYWITRERVRWSRVLLGPVAGIAAISLLIFAFSIYEAWPRRVQEYAGLRLGMSQDEVIYIKGQPTEVLTDNPLLPGYQEVVIRLSNLQEASDFSVWPYKTGDARVDVVFDADRSITAS